MSRRRLTRAQLADHYAREWLAERNAAEAVPCRYCDQDPDQTCVNPRTGQPLHGLPAHNVRIADATAATQTRPRPADPPDTRSPAP